MTLAPAGGGTSPPRENGGGCTPVRVRARAGDGPAALLAAAGLCAGSPRPVIVVGGGAGDLRGRHLAVARAVLGPAVRVATTCTHAAVVDGGTASGVMALLGEERARDPAAMPILLGVAPAGRVDDGAAGEEQIELEPHHTHVVLADSDRWGGETPLLAALAHGLAGDGRVAMVLAGGGDGAREEVRTALRRGWPLFVIKGTGGLADELATAQRRRRDHPQLQGEPGLGEIRVFGRDPLALGRAVGWELQDEPALKDAWLLFATYDGLAVRLHDTFERFQSAILALGILATAIALAHEGVDGAPLRGVLHWAAIVTPIAVSVLAALANRRAAGKRWVLLRAAAEAVKSEIYRYRTRTGVYSQTAVASGDTALARARLLADRLAAIDGGLIQTDASSGPLTPYAGPLPPAAYGAEAGDDGVSVLTAQRYVAIRLADQLAYYRSRVRTLDRRRARLQLVTLAAGGAGAVLAAAGAEIWIGLTTAFAGAALAQLGYLQVDNTVVAFNQAGTQLAALEREFRASRGMTPSFETLVTTSETVLTKELSGWVQQMTDALAQLQDEQTKAAEETETSRSS